MTTTTDQGALLVVGIGGLMLTDLLTLSALQLLVLALILFVLALCFRAGWGVGAWLAGRLH